MYSLLVYKYEYAGSVIVEIVAFALHGKPLPTRFSRSSQSVVKPREEKTDRETSTRPGTRDLNLVR
jgi:hypothetical protein